MAAPTFEPYLIKKKRGLNKERNKPRVYFYSCTDLTYHYSRLRDINATAETKFSVTLLYGSSPEKPTTLVVTARDCAKLILRKVPKDYKMCQAIFKTATEEWKLDATKQLVYKGESKSQVTERMRLVVSQLVEDLL